MGVPPPKVDPPRPPSLRLNTLPFPLHAKRCHNPPWPVAHSLRHAHHAPAPNHPPPLPGFQFVNGDPAAAPGSLLLSAAAAAARQADGLFSPGDYSGLLGRDTTAAGEYHAYTIDWQPDHVAW
jgi:hypothetical protein